MLARYRVSLNNITKLSAAKAYTLSHVCGRDVKDIYASSSLLFSPWSLCIRCTPGDCKKKVSVLCNSEGSLFLASKIHLSSHSHHCLYELREFMFSGNWLGVADYVASRSFEGILRRTLELFKIRKNHSSGATEELIQRCAKDPENPNRQRIHCHVYVQDSASHLKFNQSANVLHSNSRGIRFEFR